MRVDGVGREGMQGGIMAQAADSVSKNIRAQIMDAQKQLQELAANKDLEPEEKMERRKEIQQRITELNQQLRQHELDLRREKQQQVKRSEESGTQAAQKKAENAQNGKAAAGLSQSSMEAMVSADRALGQAKVQGNVASAMKARANVLKSEIEHSGRGAAVEKKQESVADIEERVQELAKEQAASLNKAGKELAKAGEEARAERKAQNKKADEEAKTDGAKAENGSGNSENANGIKTGERNGDLMIGSAESAETEKAGESSHTEAAAAKESAGNQEEKNQEEEIQQALQNGMPVYRRVDILL